MEILYHYIWKTRLLGKRLTLTDGRQLEILSPGVHNLDAGPDFSHARIRIGDTEWAGNVEIHVKASDWHRHGHTDNPAYHNVILHVVAVSDDIITRPDGTDIPQLELHVPRELYLTYARLAREIDNVKCLDLLPSLSPLAVTDWLETLSVERLHLKAARILDTYRQFDNDWSQALFTVLARAMGFGLNGVPFELMAKATPLKYLFRHADDPFQIEAIMFGQAGMLDPTVNIFDEYYQRLCREYMFLARKYGLRPIRADLWKYARTRPQNFPHRRIAILCAAITTDFNLLTPLLEAKGDNDILRELFRWSAGRYWEDHSTFGVDGGERKQSLTLSERSIDLLMINLAAPFYFAYAAVSGNPEIAEYGVTLLMNIPAESNSIVAQWKQAGIPVRDALRSQALIQLRKEYCDRNRCLECRFGHQLLRREAAGLQPTSKL